MGRRIVALLIIIAPLIVNTLEGQILFEFDFLIDNPDIVNKETYFLYPDRDTLQLTYLTEIDRKNKIAWKSNFSEYYGTSRNVIIYDNNWKPIEKQLISSDSSLFSKWLFIYNDKGQIVKNKHYSRRDFDNYENIHLVSELEFTYNSKGQKTGFKGLNYIKGDTTKQYQTKRKIKYDKKGRLKKQKSYSTQKSPERYILTSTLKIKYSQQNGLEKRKTIQKLVDLKRTIKRESIYNSQNQQLKTIEYRDGKAIRFVDNKYLNNLKVESTHVDTFPETKLKFVVKHIYNRKNDM